MGEPEPVIDEGQLQRFVPINALNPTSLRQIASKAVIKSYREGERLFRRGDRDGKTVYLLSGAIELLAGGQSIAVEAGSETARHPLGQHQPRQVDAVAKSSVQCLLVDTNMLDMMLTWQQSSSLQVGEIEQDESDDWMTKLLQNKLFLKLPPANIQKIIMLMEDMEVSKGDTIIRQGDEGDFYYYIRQGKCEIVRQPRPNAAEIKLAQLPAGESFGEEALVSEEKRNATVRMLSDGTLMRLSKKDFVKLIHEPLHNNVDYYQSEVLVADGGIWLDVRLPDEYANSHISDALNIPLQTLRLQLAQLDKQRKYVVCCDTGRRSATAAFLMNENGFDAYVLAGGLMNLPQEVFLASDRKGERLDPSRANPNIVSAREMKSASAPRAEAPAKGGTAPAKQPAAKEADKKQAASGGATKSGGTQAVLARAREALERARRVKDKSAEPKPPAAPAPKPTGEKREAEIAEQGRQLEESEAAKLLLNQEVTRLEDELTRLNHQLQEALDENQRLEVELTKRAGSAKDAAAGLESRLARERERWEKRLAETEEKRAREIEDLRRGSEEALAKARSTAEAERTSLREHLSKLQGASGEKQELAEALELMGGQMESVQKALQAAEAARSAAEQGKRDAERAREDLEQSLHDSKRDAEEQRANAEAVQKLREDLERAREERASAERDAASAQRNLRELQEDSGRDRAEVQRVRDELEQTQRALTHSLNEKSSAEQSVEKLRGQLQAMEKERSERDSRTGEELERARIELKAVQAALVEMTTERDGALEQRDRAEQERQSAADELEAARAARRERDRELKEELDRLHERIGEYQGRMEEAMRIKEEAEAARAAAEDKASAALEGYDDHQRALEEQIQEYQTVLGRMEEELGQVGKITEEADSARKQSEDHVVRMARELENLRKALKSVEHEKEEAWQARKRAEQEVAKARRNAVDAIQKANQQVNRAQDDLKRVRTEAEAEIQRRLEMETSRMRPAPAPAASHDSRFHDVKVRHEREVTLGTERIRDTQSVGTRTGMGHKAVGGRKRGKGLLILVLMLVTMAAVAGFVFKDQVLELLRQQGIDLLPADKPASSDGSAATVAPQPAAAPAPAPQRQARPEPPAPVAPPRRPAAPPVPAPAPASRTTIQDPLRAGGVGPVMVLLEGGEFLMGADPASPDNAAKPQHPVRVRPVAVGRFEVTFEEFDRFVQSTGREAPNDAGRGRGNLPVVNVSWNEARAYAAWLSEQTGRTYRLPTEAEWEYAARAGQKGVYWWGSAIGSGNANCFNCGTEWDGLQPAPAGSFKANPFGLNDTSGNVAEWVQDCYFPSYDGAPNDGSSWEAGTCTERVVRGGSFASSAKALRTSSRERFSLDTRLDNLGFRLVREP